jgi:hypothetical protein
MGLALTAFNVWMKLSPEQRRQVLLATRRHGPKVAKAAAKLARPKRP